MSQWKPEEQQIGTCFMNVIKVHEMNTKYKATVSRSRNKVIFLNQEKMTMMNGHWIGSSAFLLCEKIDILFWITFFENTAGDKSLLTSA